MTLELDGAYIECDPGLVPYIRELAKRLPPIWLHLVPLDILFCERNYPVMASAGRNRRTGQYCLLVDPDAWSGLNENERRGLLIHELGHLWRFRIGGNSEQSANDQGRQWGFGREIDALDLDGCF